MNEDYRGDGRIMRAETEERSGADKKRPDSHDLVVMNREGGRAIRVGARFAG